MSFCVLSEVVLRYKNERRCSVNSCKLEACKPKKILLNWNKLHIQNLSLKPGLHISCKESDAHACKHVF